MRAKDKKRKVFKLSIKRIIIFFASVIILLNGIILYNHYFTKNEVMAKETSSGINEVSNMKISNAKEIDLDKIINENSGIQRKEEYYFEEMDLEYITKYRNNSSLPKGVIEVKQEGREGKHPQGPHFWLDAFVQRTA